MMFAPHIAPIHEKVYGRLITIGELTLDMCNGIITLIPKEGTDFSKLTV